MAFTREVISFEAVKDVKTVAHEHVDSVPADISDRSITGLFMFPSPSDCPHEVTTVGPHQTKTQNVPNNVLVIDSSLLAPLVVLGQEHSKKLTMTTLFSDASDAWMTQNAKHPTTRSSQSNDSSTSFWPHKHIVQMPMTQPAMRQRVIRCYCQCIIFSGKQVFRGTSSLGSILETREDKQGILRILLNLQSSMLHGA